MARRIVCVFMCGLMIVLFAGCSTSPIVGEWEDKASGTSIEITADKFFAHAGPIQITLKYRVQKREGDKTEIMLIDETGESPATLTVADGGKTLVITDNGMYGGRWSKK